MVRLACLLTSIKESNSAEVQEEAIKSVCVKVRISFYRCQSVLMNV